MQLASFILDVNFIIHVYDLIILNKIPSSLWYIHCIKKNVNFFRGFFPKGGGEVHLRVSPCSGLQGVTMTAQGTVTRVYGISFVAGNLPKKVAHIMSECATAVIKEHHRGVPINIDVVKEMQGIGIGCGIL